MSGQKVIYDNIQRLAKEQRWTNHSLEKKLDFANGTIGRWKSNYPTIKNLLKVAEVLQVDISELLKGVSNETN